MGRGRQHAPPTTEVGIWFEHRGSQSAGTVHKHDATSTESMLSAPYRSSSAHLPSAPPPKFGTKSERNYRDSNRFSEHDNRNSFQDHGVYFGDGQKTRQLGRSLIASDTRLHQTNTDFLKHYGRQVTNTDFNSTYQKSFKGKDTEERPRYRRFAKHLPALESMGRIPLDTTTTDWLPGLEQAHKTSTQVLAVTQEPFPKHNPWQYSYHSKRNIYPQYARRSEPVIDNVLNRYGAAYNTSGTLNSTGISQFAASTYS